jgi:glycosyltransferase involved in cell wall biosynthesis
MAKVSIIIPTYNRDQYLDYTLAGFLQQTYRDFELVVVDDGSQDHTREVIDKYINKLPISYSFQEHRGLSSARNKALDIANGNVIINIDSDRIPSPHFIEEHLKTIESNDKVVSIGFKPLILSKYNMNLKISYLDLVKVLHNNPSKVNDVLAGHEVDFFTIEDLIADFHGTMQRVHIRDPKDNYKEVREEYTDSLVGFNMGWAMATGGNVGYDRTQAINVEFDTNYQGWGLEDTDFAYQLYSSGYDFVFSEKACNYHQAHPRGAAELEELNNNFQYFCSNFNSPEVYLFARVFKNDFLLTEANKLLGYIKQDENNILIKDYIQVLQRNI